MRDIDLACGSVAEFDHSSGISYRCTTCGAVVGSVGMPRECAEMQKEAEEKELMWKILKKKLK